jgi:hypothetical protein
MINDKYRTILIATTIMVASLIACFLWLCLVLSNSISTSRSVGNFHQRDEPIQLIFDFGKGSESIQFEIELEANTGLVSGN